jgi:hypothetical protein
MKVPMRWVYPARFLFAALMVISLSCFLNAQSAKETYSRIGENPSKFHWCLPTAGDDPNGIIGHACQTYSDCRESAGLTEAADQKPFPSLSDEQRLSLKKCHQALYNVARVNPQLKGSRATQEWLEQGVSQGTEAKPFSVPNSYSPPR